MLKNLKKKILFNYTILLIISFFFLFYCQNKLNNKEKSYNFRKKDSSGNTTSSYEDDIEIAELKINQQKDIYENINNITKDWKKNYLSNWYSQASFLTPKGRSISNVLYYLNKVEDSISRDQSELAKQSLQKIKKIKDRKIKGINSKLDDIIQKIDDYNSAFKHLYECQARNFCEFLYSA
ncbi:MAG: hypothetical protein GY830_06255 [Bacteroidetes bacterium]|nr:hypothetical protein [Bacteroidota bacterium]